MRSAGVGNIAGILPFLRASYTRRTDIMQITDSNGAQNTITGHFEGMALNFAAVFGAYASAFVAGSPAPGAGLATDQAGHTGGTNGSVTAVDANFTALKFPAVSVVDGASVPWGNFDWCNTFKGDDNPGSYLQLKSRFPLDLNGKIGYCPVVWRPAASGITKLVPQVQGLMNGGPAFGILSKTVTAPTRSSDGIDEIICAFARGEIIDLSNATNPANNLARYKGMGFKISPNTWDGSATGMDGANVGGIIGHRITDEEKFAGVAVSPFYQFGGKPTRAASWDLCGLAGSGGVSDAALGTWLKALVKAQRSSGGTQLAPMLCVQIIEGGNDSGDTGALGTLAANKSLLSSTGAYQSATEQAVASNTATGYYNNTVTIIRRIRYVWETVLGYNRANLFFLIGCYHPQSPTISAAQWSFVRTTMVTGMASVAASERNVTYVDGYKLGNYAEFGRANGASSGGVDGTDYMTAGAQEYSTGLTPFTAVVNTPWYRDPSNQDAHLNQQGYLAWGQRVVQAVMDAAAGAGLYTNVGAAGVDNPRVMTGRGFAMLN